MQKIILSIGGMSCSACSNGLEKYLNRQPGIKNATVNLVMATAKIEYEDNLKIEDLEKYIKEAGFSSLGIARIEDNSKQISKLPFIVYGILAFILMYISMSHMFNLPIFSYLDMHKYPINFSICLLILSIPFLFYGFDIIKSGIKNLIHRMPNMDTLVSIGVISSFLYSLFSVIMIFLGNHSYVENLYFESTVFVIYFIKLGRFIDKNSKEKTKDAIKKLVTITPKMARLKIDDGYKEVTIDEVKKDDLLVCLAGDKIAVDGIVVSGKTHVDESFITGESKPVSKKIDDKVIAGSINYDGTITYKAEKIGRDSTISEIVNLVVEATNTKAPIALLADKICSYFVPTIIVIAFLTFFVSLILQVPFTLSLNRFVTILVVACPCALGLATPLAIVVSEGVCARDGIIVKKSQTLEILNKVDTIVFDKTGTLTNGNLSVSEVINYSNYDLKKLFYIIGSLEYSSTHPIAKGIMNYVNENEIKYDNIEIENLSGFGIKGKINDNIYYICNSKMLDKLKIKNDYKNDEERLINDGNSISYIVENNNILGLIGIKDTIRDNVEELIKILEKRNIEVIMLTGDNEELAQKVGKELGIKNVIANVTPSEKTDKIKELKRLGKKVIMVGDGINDSPSLAFADVGISLSGATDIASDSADVILMNNNLFKIVDLLIISKKTITNIKQNIFWAFLYNICMISIATGLFSQFDITINPMIACISMILSSLLVIFNALRLKKIKFD